MRFLVLSDIHANSTALEAVLAAAEGRWEKALCLGDIVDYGPDPNEATERIRALEPAIIRGNHDRAAIGQKDLTEFNPIAQIAARWTHDQLKPETMDYLTALPPGPLPAHGMTLVHGAYEDEDEYVFAPAQAMCGLIESPTPVTLFGHTHHQCGFTYRAGQIAVLQPRQPEGANFTALRLDATTRYLLNPGSVGQPRDGDSRAAFAIADLDHQVIEFWRVPYDIPVVQARMQQAGLPRPLIDRLTYGH